VSFRFKALAKQREPDEFDAPTELTSPRGWLALLALGTATIAALAWAVLGRLPVTVTASGLITSPYGTAEVQSLYAGLVTRISVSDGSQVRAGQDVAVVQDALGASHQVRTLFAGEVIGTEVSDGEVVGPGTPVATLERGASGGGASGTSASGSGQQLALLFVAPSQVTGIAPGESVGLAVASAPSAAFGLLRGQVQSVSQFPLTQQEEVALAGGPVAASQLGADGGMLLVTVALRRDAHTASGYAWTTAAGPPQPLPAVVPATGTIALGDQTPITLLFGR
jgi:biotin carboxyl carrier protein